MIQIAHSSAICFQVLYEQQRRVYLYDATMLDAFLTPLLFAFPFNVSA
jgi:hypothetical protein